MELGTEKSFIMAKRLKMLRESKGLSHEKLRDAIIEQYGVTISRDSLMNYEVTDAAHSKAYKNQGMNVKYLQCLSSFYGVSTDYLLGISDTQSPNPNVTEAMKYTGLTEKNVNLLHADYHYFHDHLPDACSSFFYLDEEAFRALANDLVGLLQNGIVLARFRQLHGIYSKFKDIGALPFDDEWITYSDIENLSKARGLATVPIRDSISFYAAQLAAEIQREFEEKYVVPERSRKEVKKIINGKEYTLYVE